MAVSTSIDGQNAAEVAAWRKQTRRELLAARAALPVDEHRSRSAHIRDNVIACLRGAPARVVGAYAAMRGEVDLLPVLASLPEQGIAVALPVVPGPGQVLRFRAWRPGEPLCAGSFGVLEPCGGEWVAPDLLLVPVLGYDAAKYRLGYGGGFYDRTLSVAARPAAIGVGFSLGRLATIYPQAWDVPLDRIVTERETAG